MGVTTHVVQSLVEVVVSIVSRVFDRLDGTELPTINVPVVAAVGAVGVAALLVVAGRMRVVRRRRRQAAA